MDFFHNKYERNTYKKHSVLHRKENETMQLKTSRNCHGLYNLQYHLILVTKYRKPCINKELFDYLYRETIRLFKNTKVELEEINYEPDHIHMLISIPPQVQISKLINSYKSATARLIRNKFKDYLSRFYWGDHFWNRSYLILSSGGAPIEIIKTYIQNQKEDAAITT